MTDCASDPLERSIPSPSASSSSVSVSRRRLAFRPQSLKPGSKPFRYDGAQPSTSENGTSTNVQAKIDATGSTELSSSNLECDPHQSNHLHQSQQYLQKTRRRLVTNWSFQETLVFYDGLKQHGKDFESIARYMARKKFQKDRDQIRNYYFNAFKIWRSKAQMEERDWSGIPRDARELFVLLNGCEWRRKTGGNNFEPVKFKTLIMEGSTSVRIKKKKSLVTIRTPYCPCLLKFFPYEKSKAEIPTHLSLKLTPYRYVDRNYVISCEQNPLLHIKVNVNDKITNVFELLKKKWITPIQQLATSAEMETLVPMPTSLIRLRVTESVQIHKVEVDFEMENFSLLSLRKLKRDHGVDDTDETEKGVNQPIQSENVQLPSTSFSTDENSNEAQKMFSSTISVKAKPTKESNIIKLGSSLVKEVFDLDEPKLKEGLTTDNVGNASFLQIFYLCGMTNEINLTYEICELSSNVDLSWRCFISLVSRDYGELIAKALNIQQQQQVILNKPENDSENFTETESASEIINVDQLDSTAQSYVNNTSEINQMNSLRRKRAPSSGKNSITNNLRVESTTAAIVSNSAITSREDNNNHVSSVVEEENAQFLQQLREMQQQQIQKRAKRQVKVLPNPKRGVKTFGSNTSFRQQSMQQHPSVSEMTTLEYIKSQQHRQQKNLLAQQQQQNVPAIEITDENAATNRSFCNVLSSNNSVVETDQRFTYLIASASGVKTYATNNDATISSGTQLATSQQPVHNQQLQEHQHPAIVYQTQELIGEPQPVLAFLQDDGTSLSVVPVVTAVELENRSQFGNLNNSVNTIPRRTEVNQIAPENRGATTIFVAHNPPTDFSHFATTSTTANVELHPFVPTYEDNNSTTTNCIQSMPANSISASFRSPMKTSYGRRPTQFRTSGVGNSNNNNNGNTSQNDIIVLADPELTNASTGDFSIDSLSAFIGAGSNSNVGTYQLTPGSSSILLLDSSPSKTLPEDVRNAYEQMMKENSIDYCRNFEQLTRNMDLIHKNVGGNDGIPPCSSSSVPNDPNMNVASDSFVIDRVRGSGKATDKRVGGKGNFGTVEKVNR